MLHNLANRIFGDVMLLFNRDEEHARNRLYILGFSVYANIIVILCGGYFFTGFLLKLGASDTIIGLVSIITGACGVAAVFSPFVFDRLQRKKPLLLLLRGAYYLLLLGFITALPYAGFTENARLPVILTAFALANIISALSGSGLSVWHLQSLPEPVRPSFYANLQMIIGMLNMILLNLAGLFADFFKSRGQELFGVELLRCAAFLFAVAEMVCLSRIREYPSGSPHHAASLKDMFSAPPRDRRYRAVLAVAALWGFSSAIPGPFFQVYLLKDLNIGYSFLSVVNLLNIPVLLIAMPLWSRAVARWNDLKTFPALAALVSLHFLSLAFVTKLNFQWLYPISILYYFVISAGITQTVAQMPFRFIPDDNESGYISFYAVVNACAVLLGTAAGQAFVLATTNTGYALRGVLMGNKQLLMGLAGVAVLLGACGMAAISRRLTRAAHPLEKEPTVSSRAA